MLLLFLVMVDILERREKLHLKYGKKEDKDKSIKYSNHMHLTTFHFPEDNKRVQTESCWGFFKK